MLHYKFDLTHLCGISIYHILGKHGIRPISYTWSLISLFDPSNLHPNKGLLSGVIVPVLIEFTGLTPSVIDILRKDKDIMTQVLQYVINRVSLRDDIIFIAFKKIQYHRFPSFAALTREKIWCRPSTDRTDIASPLMITNTYLNDT